MSPEWMIVFDRQTTAMQRSRRSAFADPLERTEWRGLQGVNTLFSRWLGGRPIATAKEGAKACFQLDIRIRNGFASFPGLIASL